MKSIEYNIVTSPVRYPYRHLVAIKKKHNMCLDYSKVGAIVYLRH